MYCDSCLHVSGSCEYLRFLCGNCSVCLYKRKEEVEKFNTAETLAYTVESTLNDAGDKVDEGTKKEVKEKVKELRDAVTAKDLAKVESLTEELTKKIQEIGAKMYQEQPGEQQASQGEQQQAQGDKQDNEQTVDADFKEQ